MKALGYKTVSYLNSDNILIVVHITPFFGFVEDILKECFYVHTTDDDWLPIVVINEHFG